MQLVRLDIYVASHCLAGQEAQRLAIEAARRFPDAEIRLINLDETPPPEQIVAVPTYVLNGRIISLGNPEPEALFAQMAPLA